ncbi:phosphomethylpyrimidine kinase [Streptococcus pneumoniae]|nr:phosphomethylpyrimidine kinase [Streptococcus pneumoniae]
MKNNRILALSGNDIFSGGGLSADLATYTLNGLHGFVAVTCLTALTEKGFEVFPTDDTIFQHELDSLRDVEFGGIKIGLLPTVSVAEKALDFIKQRPGIPVVLDPVLVCKETHDVAVSELCQELIRFFPYVSVITPNLPEAELKIFLVASVDERAERRYKENIAKGIETDLETLKKEIAARDYKDSHRETSPLKQAEDAVYLDTTGLNIQEVVEKIKAEAEKRM